LNDSRNDPPSLLEYCFIIPSWVDIGKYLGYSVMFSEKQSVRPAKTWNDVDSGISCTTQTVYKSINVYFQPQTPGETVLICRVEYRRFNVYGIESVFYIMTCFIK